MSFQKEKKERIENYILELIKNKETDNHKSKTIKTFGISPTTYYRYLRSMEESNLIRKDENGYQLVEVQRNHVYFENNCLEEDEIFRKDIDPFIKDLSKNAQNIWYYAFTEIMNNAIEHSNAKIISVFVEETALDVIITIIDDGIGIFNNIRDFVKKTTGDDISLEDAMKELFIGKFTTKSENHSGEGIFFTSRIMDRFLIVSDDLLFSHNIYTDYNACIADALPDSEKFRKGTFVTMRLSKDTTKNLSDVFNAFAPVDEGFVKTEIKLKNFCEHGYPVSRSQARRILERLNTFREITIDFEGISDVGQAFCHEIFVVFQRKHFEIKINIVNDKGAVHDMITRVLNTARLLEVK